MRRCRATAAAVNRSSTSEDFASHSKGPALVTRAGLTYARKLRRIGAGIFSTEHMRQANKYDAKKNGRAKWVEEVEKSRSVC